MQLEIETLNNTMKRKEKQNQFPKTNIITIYFKKREVDFWRQASRKAKLYMLNFELFVKFKSNCLDWVLLDVNFDFSLGVDESFCR